MDDEVVSTGDGEPSPSETPDSLVSIPDAAAELGMSVSDLIVLLVRDGMLIEHPNGGYVPVPHPDLVELR
jgi:hypothetical protein